MQETPCIELDNNDEETIFWDKLGEDLVELGAILNEKPQDVVDAFMEVDSIKLRDKYFDNFY